MKKFLIKIPYPIFEINWTGLLFALTKINLTD